MEQILSFIKMLATTIPLEFFAVIGSFLEEIIAPIPSPLVMTTAGSLAHSQERSLIFLAWLALAAALGKTFASFLYYVVADKTEDLILTRFGKLIGISHKQLESIGQHFNGTWRDDVILFLARALPIMPTSLVSVVCGCIKLNMRTYLQSTFLGYFVRSFLFLYLGYSGMAAYGNLSSEIDGIESVVKILSVGALLVFFGFLFYKRGTGDIHDWIKRITSKSK